MKILIYVAVILSASASASASASMFEVNYADMSFIEFNKAYYDDEDVKCSLSSDKTVLYYEHVDSEDKKTVISKYQVSLVRCDENQTKVLLSRECSEISDGLRINRRDYQTELSARKCEAALLGCKKAKFDAGLCD